jgi:hypothetical protein
LKPVSNSRLTFLALRIASRLVDRFENGLGEGERSEIRLLADQLSFDEIEWNRGAMEAEEAKTDVVRRGVFRF